MKLTLQDLDAQISHDNFAREVVVGIPVRGKKVEIFKDGEWIMPDKWCDEMENPVACLRDLHKMGMPMDDRLFGDFYDWAAGTTTGVIY